jgi:UDP-N-acetylglucosamine:LPS N-acetylglucosamine transferase
MNPEDLYNSRLARGWNIGLAQELKLLQALIRLSHKSITSQLRRHWRRTKPDLVVSLIPNFNRAMYQALDGARPQSPYVTILTDFADFAPHFWIEPNQAQYFICGTPKAAAQVRAMGYEESQIHVTSGMIIRPEFYRESPLDRRAERQKLGLDADRPTGIVMFGGTGSRVMQGIARRLNDTQLILICGHNAPLAQRLNAKTSMAPHLVLGFTSEIRYYMQLSDFFIGKPGPGSISEAVQQGLPVIVVRNTWTMPQERYNTDWVKESNAGIVLDSFRSVRLGVAEITDRLEELRAGIAQIRNRAVFEIPRILESIMQSGRPRNHSALGSDDARGAAVLS